MFGRLSALVGGQQPTETPTDMLPADLATTIAAARVIERAGASEDEHRALVQVPGAMFWYDAEQPSKWLAANWQLTEAQKQRALGLLGARVVQAQRESAAAAAMAHGRPAWRAWKPLERR